MNQDLQQGATNQPVDDILSADEILHKDILELMGYTNLTEEEKANHYSTMMETINNRLAARIADHLGDNDAEEWQNIAQKDEETAIIFLQERQVDLQKWLLEETIIYKAEMVKASRAIKQGVSPATLKLSTN